jgi:hypothetical protein
MHPTLPTLVAALLLAATSAAFAQFPPPGIYRCATGDGVPLGTLSLFAAGDYQFSVADGPDYKEKAGDRGNGRGQVASAGGAITAQSGPLATIYQWKGSFHTDAQRHTVFAFTGVGGAKAMCGPKG